MPRYNRNISQSDSFTCTF
ncbi:hypothetical protein CGLO_13483 [Colletotrichum gloeosporioides Cg-14]|uniref:Uncharacterized protein n=1 Tax=Colletotrichum gloeosporioides (strain Cg-14) TaxID=1237896 RepID=T0JWK7_COLGC|nr:hypothetical protein CGLO_13483 [Colletotrichum gloeosporioides Cg-14]